MHDPIEILTNEQMSEADALAVRLGVPSLALMENAGAAVANEAVKMVDAGSRIVVLCGPGNNGGDGFVAARILTARGYDVAVFLLGAVENLKGDAAEMARQWLEVGEIAAVDTADPAMARAALIVDALFGAGLARPLEGAASDAIEAANASPAEKLAVDVPSGLNGTSGHPLGACVLQADRTITFFRLKPAHLLYPGRGLCGRVTVADIGIPVDVLPPIGTTLTTNAPELWLRAFPIPGENNHKYHRGHAVVVSGPAHATGAARLAARGALRIGAGLVTLASAPEALAVNAAHLTAIMLKPFDAAAGLGSILQDGRLNAVALGPGLGIGRETCELVETVLRSGAATVLDADALTSFAADADRLSALIAGIPDRPVVITPHAGEFKRLMSERNVEPFGATTLARARRAAKKLGAIVVVKGPDTAIASPVTQTARIDTATAAINSNAPPWLATAGSGDVLAGFIAGLLAQGMPPFQAACAAVWIHAEGANLFGPGLISEDLPETVPAVLRSLYARKRHISEAAGRAVPMA